MVITPETPSTDSGSSEPLSSRYYLPPEQYAKRLEIVREKMIVQWRNAPPGIIRDKLNNKIKSIDMKCHDLWMTVKLKEKPNVF